MENEKDAIPASVERGPRMNVMLMASVKHLGGQVTTKHRVRDLSAGGARIDNAANMKCGDVVEISIGALEDVAATVAWTRSGLAGVSFDADVKPNDARRSAAAGASMETSSSKDAKVESVPPAPAAGWFSELRDPYRK